MKFTITSGEGLPIRGEFGVPRNPRGLVILVHGFKGFKDWGFFPFVAESLREANFVVCRFNMSRSGVGEDGDTFDRLDLFAGDTYTKQLRDLAAVVAHAHGEFPFLPILLLGHSRGGGVALLGAGEVPHLRGVVTWSAISRCDRWDEETKRRWRADGHMDIVNARTRQTMRLSTEILDDYEANREQLDILAAAKRLRVPLLVVHGANDESVPVAESEDIVASASDASHAVIAGASHTYNGIHPLVDVPLALSTAVAVTRRFMLAYTESRTIVNL